MKLGVMSAAGVRGLLVGALLVGGMSVTGAQPAEAQCVTQSIPGQPRNCTFTEQMRACIRAATDAYWQCRRNRGWLVRRICRVFQYVDLAGCLLLPAKQVKEAVVI